MLALTIKQVKLGMVYLKWALRNQLTGLEEREVSGNSKCVITSDEVVQ